MTLRDDPVKDELELELIRLAAVREDDQRLHRTIRAQLSSATRRSRRRRRPLRLLTAAAVSAAAAAAVLIALVAPGGSGGPSAADAAIIRQVAVAVTPPPNEILHVKVVAVQNGVQVVGESWQETSPPYAIRGVKGPVDRSGESSSDGTTSLTYDPSTQTITTRHDPTPQTFSDPIAAVRKGLTDGTAQVAGTTVIDGRRLYRIDLPNGLVGYFDTTYDQPRYLDNPQKNGTVLRMRIAAYEYLPMTGPNRSQLSIPAQHPQAGIVAAPPGTPAPK